MLQQNHETGSLVNASHMGGRMSAAILTLPRRTTVDPDSPKQVADGLLVYLKHRFGTDDLCFHSLPVSSPDGWETHTYRFELEGKRLPIWAGSGRSLVLRAYCSPHGLPRARQEFGVQRHMHERGYPVPKPLLLEENCNVFGGPFLIMEQLPGPTLFKYLSFYWWMMWPRSAGMAALQARLHSLPVADFPRPRGEYLRRKLDDMRKVIRKYGLTGLVPGWKWLANHQPGAPDRPSILHLDFHPFNLLCGSFPVFSVLDWTEADVGDHHADLGTSLMLMHCCLAGNPNLWERCGYPLARTLVIHWYLRAYRKRMLVDPQRLAYYQAMASLKRLCGYGRWLQASPLSTGCKPASIRYLHPGHLAKLQNYFRKWSGVAVSVS